MGTFCCWRHRPSCNQFFGQVFLPPFVTTPLHHLPPVILPHVVAGTPVQQTAEQVLPVCFRLLEAAVEALAADSEDGGGLLDPR